MNANTNLTVVGIDIAKNVFQLHWTDPSTGEVIRKQLTRAKILQFFANREKCLIGMEACGGSHYWARELIKLGHEVKLMPGEDVKAFNRGNKSDARDAEAIWLATKVNSPRKVAVKTEEQQAVLSIHRIRELKVKQRTAEINQIRGILMEFGLVTARGHKAIREWLPHALESLQERVPRIALKALSQLWSDVQQLDHQIKELEEDLKSWAQTQPDCQRLMQIPGVATLTATATVATIGNAKAFKNGRQFAAFLGIAPRHKGSGGKIEVLGMSKRGDGYVRKLILHGARAVVTVSKEPPKMVTRLKKDHCTNKVIGAMANKMARIMWALMAHESSYVKDYVPVQYRN